jgi:chromosome segregation ATPase
MLALQNMQITDQPLNDITNGTSTPTPTRSSNPYDFSSQLLNLTNIATNLQKEMAALSRRSKDNASDLISLKEATSSRDEDIRKTLRQITTNFDGSASFLGPAPVPGSMTRSASSFANLLDNNPFGSPPSAAKPWSVPRAASAHGFLEERVGSPSPFSVEGAASVAMLEKIIREMVTKEGQERLQSSLSELLEKSRKENSNAAKKVEELSEFIKEKSQSQALVRVPKDGPPGMNMTFDSPGATGKTRDAGGQEACVLGPDEEVKKMLQRIKDSVAHAGGATSEVKGIVRDLRGEVLGMGRELGKKLDTISDSTLNTALDRSIEDSQGKLDANDVQRIVDEGLAELKDHFARMMRQRAEQDDESFKQIASARSGPDGEEMFAVVKHALAEHSGDLTKRDLDADSSGLDRESILDAVKEGLKDFEPNIELQQFGLERDEILSVLKEGLEEYQSNKPEATFANIDKGEVYEAMQEALKDFKAPIPQGQIAQMKEELLSEVRQALAEYRPVAGGISAEDHATRHAVIEAVREGLASHGPSAPREIEISREDLFDAVKASLDGSSIPFGGLGEQVLSQLHELFDNMKGEFIQYTAANGRDTEQVLDAVKDGLESLRAEIEQYVDRAQDVTGKDEIVDTVKSGLEQLRVDIQGFVAHGSVNGGGDAQMLEYIKSEFEHLHATVGNRETSRGLDGDELRLNDAAGIILALKEGMDDLKSHVSTNRGVEDEPSEEMLEAMKEEFEQLKTALLNASAHDKSELIETIQESLGALHSKLNGSELSHLSGGATEDIINELHAEFRQLKEMLHSIIGNADREAIITGVRQSIDDLRTQLSSDQSDASAEALGAIKEELLKFREAMGTTVAMFGSPDVPEDNLYSIRSSLDEIKEKAAGGGGFAVTDDLLEAIRGEFENLRTAMATSTAHGGTSDEVLETVRLGLDDLRSHVDRKFDNPDLRTSEHGEVLDAINDGLEILRTDVIKTLSHPQDQTVNYEILDTLKDGLASLRSDIDKLKSADGRAITPKGGEIVLADGGDIGEARDISAESTAAGASSSNASTFDRSDIEKMEVMLAQLQIKVEAMSSTVQDLPTMKAAGSVSRDDIIALEVILKEIQDGIASRESDDPQGAAKKEDTDAIETLLRNTKAQLEDMAFPAPDEVVTKDQLDAVEAVVRITNDTIDSLAYKLENSTAAKADVAVVEVLAQDVKSLLEELKERIPVPDPDETKPDLMTKADLDVLGVMVTEIKTKVIEMQLPDPDDLPTKADVEQIQGLINDFRESHDRLKESYENDIAVTAKAFDDRKVEFHETVQQISDVKESLMEMKDELLSKLGDGEAGIESLGETLKTLEERTNNEPVTAEIMDLLDKITHEFERAHGSMDEIKSEHQLAAELSIEKQAEHKEALVTAFGEKLETYFDGLMTKYDDAQQAAEEKTKSLMEKAAQQEELLSSMTAMAEELRLSIDTLGATLTSFPETIDGMKQESQSVFNKVDDTYNKLDETQEGVKYEHSVTREEIAKVLAAIGGLSSDMSEHNPRFMVTLKEVQALIGQHYEHSQKASDAAVEHAQVVKELQEQIRGIGTQNEELKTNMSSLPRLMPAPSAEGASISEAYDDTAVHEKLDRLMGHAEQTKDTSVQLERLDEIHEKVVATAAEVSAFMAMQTKQIAEDRASHEKETEELALLLERRQVQKDEIESTITMLNEEKESLRIEVDALKAEKEAMAAQKGRLAAELSSLETAARIRREELHEMDRKAEMIERRMLEGVMNQSRMLLLSKTAKPPPKKKPQGRDLRVPSNASAASAQTITSSVPAMKPNHALALKSRPAIQRNGALPNSTERRIMSLNQINNNVPTGASAFSGLSGLSASGAQLLKRSHSVKSQFSRKPSWAGKRDLSISSQNKENETLSEESEEEVQRPESRDMNPEDFASDAGTERRTSYMSGTDSRMSYSVADSITPGAEEGTRMSYGTSDLSYGTGSYLTGSEIDRRTSLGSSANGVLGMQAPIEEEASEEEFHDMDGDDEEEQAVLGAQIEEALQIDTAAAAEQKQLQLAHFIGSDSGLGTDMPTARLSSIGPDYFEH